MVEDAEACLDDFELELPIAVSSYLSRGLEDRDCLVFVAAVSISIGDVAR